MGNRQMRIDQQASKWVVELLSAPDSFDSARNERLRAWLARSKGHRDAFHHALNVWACLNNLPAVSALIAGHQPRRMPSIRRYLIPWSCRWAGFGAMGALSLILLPMFPNQLVASSILYTTKIGERLTVDFDDGSVIELNTATRVWVQPSGSSRTFYLVEGEAFFAIKGSAQPPLVFAPFAVRPTGPGLFDLSRNSSFTKVSAIHGAVTVVVPPAALCKDSPPTPKAGDGTVTIHTDEGAAIPLDNNSCVTTYPAGRGKLERLLSWRHGELVFEDERADVVAMTFNRYNTDQISIENSGIGSKRISGQFDARDPSSFTLALRREVPGLGIRSTFKEGSRSVSVF